MQAIKGIAPLASVDQIVPLRNKVVYGTTGATNTMFTWSVRLAKRNTAIHATSALFLKVWRVRLGIDFVEIEKALTRIAVRSSLTLKLNKTGGLTHD